MRVNIYTSELTHTVERVTAIADDGKEYIGIRFVTASPKELKYRPGDDDRSAVTFWSKKTPDGSGCDKLIACLRSAADILEAERERQRNPNTLGEMAAEGVTPKEVRES